MSLSNRVRLAAETFSEAASHGYGDFRFIRFKSSWLKRFLPLM